MNERELMLTSILNCERTDLYTQSVELTSQQEDKLKEFEARRSRQEPLQYILGECDFMGLKFKVDPRVLIPRPETELLVDTVIQFVSGYSVSGQLQILDVCTGSGNIAISLAKHLHQSRIWAIDISNDALQVARYNALRNQVSHQIDFILLDLKDFCKNYTQAEGRFDIITANPPYIPTAQLDQLPGDVKQEPSLALDGGEDGLNFYRLMTDEIKRFLKTDGFWICEIGDGQSQAIKALLSAKGYRNTYFINDYTGTPRHFVTQP